MNNAEKKLMKVTNNRYRLGYHISSKGGWINDPNGFCYYKGYYHIFYQYHPYSSEWGPMHWGHSRSRDLIHWETLPIALAPDSSEDEDGCFSGSAIVKDDIMYLIYTGHHYYGDNDPEHFWQNQNLAYSTDGINFTKYENNPIISSAPEDSSHHFRDPKVWQIDELFYMVIGSQDKDGLGRAITYQSKNLKDWTYLGEMAKSKSIVEEGFMWECPDFFPLKDGEETFDVLLLSPQGILEQEEKFLNLFQTGYFLGQYNQMENSYVHSDFKELDYGHDFYATQTTLSPDGRRIVLGWMDMWESEFPEREDGWAGALTLPRELELKNKRVIMRPVKELEQLRVKRLDYWNRKINQPTLVCAKEKQVEVNIEVEAVTDFQLNFKSNEGRSFMKLIFKKQENKCILTRSDKKNARYALIDKHSKIKLKIFIDTSSAEIFVNNGYAVFTERFYVESAPEIWIETEKKVVCKNETYQLENKAITFDN